MAKLRMHTDSTLASLRTATHLLGQSIRSFASSTCEAYSTKELPGEQQARARRKSAKAAKKAASTTAPTGPPPPPVTVSRKRKALNLCTYKLHALGDYVATILRFGTSDSYSTQIVSHFTI